MTVKSQKAQVVIEDDFTNQTNGDRDGDTSSESEKELSSSDHSESNSDNIDDDSKELLNEGWADSIAKILKTNKPKKKKTLVLSKAKKLTDPIKKVTTEKYEIATLDGQVKKEQTVIEERLLDKDVPPKKKRKELPTLRIKPNILEKSRERILQKIATKGVVQLFNAVKMQQKDISKKLEEAGPLEVRKEKVLKNIDKRAFLDVLMGEKSSTIGEDVQKMNTATDQSQKGNKSNKDTNNASKPTWSILRDDFMMSAKLKDWDKELENEESEKEMEVDEEIESN